MSDTIKVYLASDSTCQAYGAEQAPQAGWGQFIGEWLSERVHVHNRAIGGRSSKTFVTEGRLSEILSEMRPGDYLLIQMGHNDSTASKPERYTEPYTDYRQYLKMYVDGARKRGGIPVLITPVARLHCEDGKFLNDFPDYCRSMKQLAAEENIPLLDLMELSLRHFTLVGYDNAVPYFMISFNGTDCTHFTGEGARKVAELVAQGLRELGLGLSREVK